MNDLIRHADKTFLHWIAILVFTLICIFAKDSVSWLSAYPDSWIVPIVGVLNAIMDIIIEYFGWFFRGLSTILSVPMGWIRDFLHWLPWSVSIAICVTVAHKASGWKLAAFTGLSLMYMVITGHWAPSMNSVALVALSVPIAIMIGFMFGVFGFFSRRAEKIIMPTLDMLQTIPAFAYLIPILILFGFGPVVGLIASLLFAFPPMVRNTILGLRRVPEEVIESGLMSGATDWQLFWQVRIPTSLRQILLGVNQTTMAALSMVIIASIIGGTADIGWEVLSTMRKALFGESILAGIVIALLAMNLDRITAGLATRESRGLESESSIFRRHQYFFIGAAATIVLFVLSWAFPLLAEYPRELVYAPTKGMNAGIEYIVVNYREVIEAIKNSTIFFVMLPVRIGLEQSVSPFSWGFVLTNAHIVGYAVLITAVATFALYRFNGKIAIGVAIAGMIFYFGVTQLPWPVMFAVLGLLAWQLGGMRLLVIVWGGLAFLLTTGIWAEAMMSVYLCGIAVIICAILGSAIGIWAAHNDNVSAFFRPINDTLQTMPPFVLLIPAVMFFKLGDFTALLAIISYAIVPAIRYSEHGLRNLPKEVLEAAESMGTTGWQSLVQVKLPLALPVIMLGINQTVMYGIAMLVITALVGTSDLGQRVYIGLGDGDFGGGIVAGVGMAIIAIIADRLIQAWSRKKQEAFGLA
ncbi:MAG: ABC transporter permease subunit [Alphaproteobacteria bacterium]